MYYCTSVEINHPFIIIPSFSSSLAFISYLSSHCIHSSGFFFHSHILLFFRFINYLSFGSPFHSSPFPVHLIFYYWDPFSKIGSTYAAHLSRAAAPYTNHALIRVAVFLIIWMIFVLFMYLIFLDISWSLHIFHLSIKWEIQVFIVNFNEPWLKLLLMFLDISSNNQKNLEP